MIIANWEARQRKIEKLELARQAIESARGECISSSRLDSALDSIRLVMLEVETFYRRCLEVELEDTQARIAGLMSPSVDIEELQESDD